MTNELDAKATELLQKAGLDPNKNNNLSRCWTNTPDCYLHSVDVEFGWNLRQSYVNELEAQLARMYDMYGVPDTTFCPGVIVHQFTRQDLEARVQELEDALKYQEKKTEEALERAGQAEENLDPIVTAARLLVGRLNEAHEPGFQDERVLLETLLEASGL